MAEKIQFQTNIPVELALQFLEGKTVASQFGGNQHMFTTADGRIFFVSEVVGNIISEQLKKLKVSKGEPIQITKAEVPNGNGRKSIQWIVTKLGFTPGEQPDRTLMVPVEKLTETVRAGKSGASGGAPAPVEQPVPARQSPNANSNGNGTRTKVDHNTGQSWAQALLSQTDLLIDVYAAALNYANTEHGDSVKPEDVRSILLSAFINVSKNGGANVA